MITIRIEAPCSAHLSFQPGDEIRVAALTPELQALVTSTRGDGARVAKLLSPRGKDLETRHVSPA